MTGEVLSPSKFLTGPASPRRLVCAGNDGIFIVSQAMKEITMLHLLSRLIGRKVKTAREGKRLKPRQANRFRPCWRRLKAGTC